jgi:hypothetical protein
MSAFDKMDRVEGVPEDEVPPTAPGDEAPKREKPKPLIQSSAQFVRDFIPPDYLVDGVLQRRFFYSITARTGIGKTAIMLRLTAHVALGRPINSRHVEQGRVLYFAGENPDDIRMRWLALSQEMGFDLADAEVYFIPGTFKISGMQARIRKESEEIGEFSLIVVDTSAAYFEGEDENSNAQQGAHARRLRGLCEMPGGPCVLVACHPPKNAADDNLQPRGGGSFLAEVDGNLIARKDDSAVAMHWQGKYRGPEFSEILFRLRTVVDSRLQDSKGRLIPTVIAEPMGEDAREEMATTARTQEDQLLLLLVDKPQASFKQLAEALGWKIHDGTANKMKVSRTLDTLEKAKLVKRSRDGFTLTPAGETAIEKLRPSRRPADD